MASGSSELSLEGNSITLVRQKKDNFVNGEIRKFIYNFYKNIHGDIHLGLVCREVGEICFSEGMSVGVEKVFLEEERRGKKKKKGEKAQ